MGRSHAGLQQLGEIAPYHILVRDRRGLRYSLPQTKSFVIDEEKCFAFLDRAAKSGPELILLVRRFLRGNDEERRSVEDIVAKIFEDISVESVGAGFDYGI